MRARPLANRWAALAAAVLLPLLSSCAKESEPTPAAQGRIVEYTVRGRVVDLFEDPVEGPSVNVHHEPIPSFESQGKVVGMHAMVMPFPIADDVSPLGLEPDAIIELTFRVHYGAETELAESWEIIDFKVLPEHTELIFNGESDEANVAPPPDDGD